MKKMNEIAFAQVICALAIVNYHTSILQIPVLSHVAKFGFILNTIFVFLSGYLLSKSLSATEKPTLGSFLQRRIDRIYPSLHLALIAIAIIYLFSEKEFTIGSFLLTATGFAYFFGETTFGLHLWFVSVILACYLACIPTYFAIKGRPVLFFAITLTLTFLIIISREKSFFGIYTKISSDILYRFIYHYIVFSIAIYLGMPNKNNISIKNNWLLIGLLFLYFPYMLGRAQFLSLA